MSTPIEIVREYHRWRRAQGQYAGLCQCPHTPEEIGLALDSVLSDAERFQALERAHDDANNPLGFGVTQNYYGRTAPAQTLSELADRLREGAR